MVLPTTKVVYICEDCHEPFMVEQGRRRRYCPRCETKRRSDAGKQGRQLQLSRKSKPKNGSAP